MGTGRRTAGASRGRWMRRARSVNRRVGAELADDHDAADADARSGESADRGPKSSRPRELPNGVAHAIVCQPRLAYSAYSDAAASVMCSEPFSPVRGVVCVAEACAVTSKMPSASRISGRRAAARAAHRRCRRRQDGGRR